ncbi:hypothetical protein ATCC90586_006089 [Pythium insidiosum]|nr:hypothetical protein ATCC90586_006089 [Pythium insidiosum]
MAANTSAWSAHTTKDGRVYYYNRHTKQSSWEKPEDFESEGVSSTAVASSDDASGAKAVEWEELWDPKNARAYYYNRGTRKTQWARPEGVEIKPYGGSRVTGESASSSADPTNPSRERQKKIEKKREKGATTDQDGEDTEDGKEALRLLKELSRPDAIMEANVLNLINGFLRAYNDSDGPEILVQKLSSSYRAVSSKRSAAWNPAADILYNHVKDIIEQHYEPKLWRRMLIELAEKHKSCGLLQYAVRRISGAGHHKELASIATANAFFPVFNGILLDAFCRSAIKSCPGECKSKLKGFLAYCQKNQGVLSSDQLQALTIGLEGL